MSDYLPWRIRADHVFLDLTKYPFRKVNFRVGFLYSFLLLIHHLVVLLFNQSLGLVFEKKHSIRTPSSSRSSWHGFEIAFGIKDFKEESFLYEITVHLAFAHSFINPILFLYMYRSLRKNENRQFFSWFTSRRRRRRSPLTSSSYSDHAENTGCCFPGLVLNEETEEYNRKNSRNPNRNPSYRRHSHHEMSERGSGHGPADPGSSSASFKNKHKMMQRDDSVQGIQSLRPSDLYHTEMMGSLSSIKMISSAPHVDHSAARGTPSSSGVRSSSSASKRKEMMRLAQGSGLSFSLSRGIHSMESAETYLQDDEDDVDEVAVRGRRSGCGHQNDGDDGEHNGCAAAAVGCSAEGAHHHHHQHPNHRHSLSTLAEVSSSAHSAVETTNNAGPLRIIDSSVEFCTLKDSSTIHHHHPLHHADGHLEDEDERMSGRRNHQSRSPALGLPTSSASKVITSNNCRSSPHRPFLSRLHASTSTASGSSTGHSTHHSSHSTQTPDPPFLPPHLPSSSVTSISHTPAAAATYSLQMNHHHNNSGSDHHHPHSSGHHASSSSGHTIYSNRHPTRNIDESRKTVNSCKKCERNSTLICQVCLAKGMVMPAVLQKSTPTLYHVCNNRSNLGSEVLGFEPSAAAVTFSSSTGRLLTSRSSPSVADLPFTTESSRILIPLQYSTDPNSSQTLPRLRVAQSLCQHHHNQEEDLHQQFAIPEKMIISRSLETDEGTPDQIMTKERVSSSKKDEKKKKTRNSHRGDRIQHHPKSSIELIS